MTTPHPATSAAARPELARPTQTTNSAPIDRRYQVALFLAWFGLFTALMAPVMVSMQLKAQQIDPGRPATVIASVLPVRAFAALLANPLAGALSDRTRTRWGRRRPRMAIGTLVFLASLVWIGFAATTTTLLIGAGAAQGRNDRHGHAHYAYDRT